MTAVQQAQPPQPNLPQTYPLVQPSPTSASTNDDNNRTSGGNNVKSTTSDTSSRTKATRSRPDHASTSSTSKSATLALIRRVLAPEKKSSSDVRSTPAPIENILPPLTSSNDVDVELYAIIAIIVKDLVNTWYSKITTDHIFVDEIIAIIAHCSRALEQRLRHVDVPALVLDEIPAVIEQHVLTYRTARLSMAHQSYGVTTRSVYHTLNPHPALAPLLNTSDADMITKQSQNEAAYRQLLVQGALAVLLPTEDLQNPPLRTLVGDILADLIIGQAVAGKVCEGWFLHETIEKVITAVKQQVKPKTSGQEIREGAKTRLEEFGLLSSKDSKQQTHSRDRTNSKAALWFWQAMQLIYLAVVSLRFVVKGLTQARSSSTRSRPQLTTGGSLKISQSSEIRQTEDSPPQPVLAYGVSSCVSTFIRFHDRMPWLASLLAFWQHVLIDGHGRLGAGDSLFDRFLHQTLQKFVFTPDIIPSALLNLRAALFPNNALGPPAPPPPTPERQLEIRRKAAQAILSVIPSVVAKRYFEPNGVTSTNDEGNADEAILVQIEEDILDVLGDSYMNKHLIYGIIELVLVRLVPEMAESGVAELMAERGVAMGSSSLMMSSAAVNDEEAFIDLLR